MKRHGRRRPYTQIGIRRLPCARCGKPAEFTWNACADGGLRRPICVKCDVLLNRIVLRFMNDPDWKAKVAAYAARLSAA